jgi:hypothetical protein
MTQIGESRLLKKEQNAALALDTIPTVGYKQGIHDQLTNHAGNLVMAQYDQQSQYVLYRLDEQTFYVKRKRNNAPTATNWREENFGLYMVSSFERTRIVRIVNHGNGRYLLCSCYHFERYGVGCRHTYKVLKRHPEAYDVAVRWHKGFRYGYLKEGYADVTAMYEKAIESPVTGPIYSENENLWPVGEGEAPLPFFMETLPSKTPKIRQGNYWATGMHNGSQSGIEAAHRTSKNTDKHAVSVAGCEEVVELSQDATNFNLKDDSDYPFYDNNDGDDGGGGNNDDDDETFSQPPAVETMQTTNETRRLSRV